MTAETKDDIIGMVDSYNEIYSLDFRYIDFECSTDALFAPISVVPPTAMQIRGCMVISEAELTEYFPTDENGDLIFLAGGYPEEGEVGFVVCDYVCDTLMSTTAFYNT